VTRWVDGQAWNETSQYNAMRSVFRVFNWAVDEGLIEKNPFKGMKRPRPRSRDRYLTEDEYRALLTASRGTFKTLLFALRQTGARPCEVRNLTWDQVHSDRVPRAKIFA
jgi:integrase